MATLPKSEPRKESMTAEELLAIRGTPEFEAEYRRQMLAIAEHDHNISNRDAKEFVNWDVPGWTYDADL